VAILLHEVEEMNFMMVTLFSSSNTAPLTSAIICCTAVVTLNMWFREELLTLEARTE